MVVPEPDEHGLTAIAARVVAAPSVDGEALRRELRRHLHERLPSHRRPLLISLVDALPRNPRGKLERPRLAAV
jgi:long-chain acyl-CoA synthetase